jgi:hypothetical protein
MLAARDFMSAASLMEPVRNLANGDSFRRPGGVRVHPAVIVYANGNQVYAPIVLWHGRDREQNVLRCSYDCAKSEDP